MQRSRECEREQNRSFRRSCEHMTEGQRRREMRLMYAEIGTFAAKSSDPEIKRVLLSRYEQYVRKQSPISKGIRAAHAAMSKWYDECRNDYLSAHYEDAKNGQR